jgi:protein arginine kinase activator
MKVGGALPLQKLARMKLELSEAVKKEEFEKAAKLRDRIKELEEQMRNSDLARHLSDQ